MCIYYMYIYIIYIYYMPWHAHVKTPEILGQVMDRTLAVGPPPVVSLPSSFDCFLLLLIAIPSSTALPALIWLNCCIGINLIYLVYFWAFAWASYWARHWISCILFANLGEFGCRPASSSWQKSNRSIGLHEWQDSHPISIGSSLGSGGGIDYWRGAAEAESGWVRGSGFQSPEWSGRA